MCVYLFGEFLCVLVFVMAKGLYEIMRYTIVEFCRGVLAWEE
jgi:hypothetical protein